MITTSKDQNVKNQNVENQNVKKNIESQKMTFDIPIFFDAIGNIRPSKFSRQKYFRLSDLTYGVRKDQNVENQKYQLPMVYYLCVPRPVGG